MRFTQIALLAWSCLALTATVSAKPTEEKIQQEITSEFLKLVDQAADNFPSISALKEAYKDPDKTVSLATPRPALHANLYFVTEMRETKRRGYSVQYQGIEAVRRITAVVRALPTTAGAAWTLEGEPGTSQAKWQIDCRRDGRAVASLLVNPDNTAFLAITIFAAPVTDPAEIVKQIDDLIVAAKRDFAETSRSPTLDPDRPNASYPVPSLMHSNEASVYTTDQSYPTFRAKWYDSSAGSGIMRTTIYAHLDELVASGRATKLIDTRTPAGGGKLYVAVGTVGVQWGSDDSNNKPGMELGIGRFGEKPGYAARSYARTPAATDSRASAPARSTAPVTHEHTCVRCDGRGRIDTTDRYGHHVNTTCPICGGNGHVSF